MPSGYPGSGPYAGRGLQTKTIACPNCGKSYNAHYDRYTGHVCKAAKPKPVPKKLQPDPDGRFAVFNETTDELVARFKTRLEAETKAKRLNKRKPGYYDVRS